MLTLFHDYTSPASAVAVARLQRLADDGVPVSFEGYEAGVDAVLPVTLDVATDVDRVAAEAQAEGVVLRRPPTVPPTGLAHVVGTVAERAGLGASWRATAYRAYWADGAALGDREVLAALAVAAGIDGDDVRTALGDRLFLARVRRRVGEHRRNGVGGVPTILAARTLVPGLLDDADLRALARL